MKDNERIARVEFLFGQIHKSATADEAYSALDRHMEEMAIHERNNRGEWSERNVMRAMNSLPNIIGVRRTEKYSEEDMRGIDMVIEHEGGLIPLQVKSSEKGIREFAYQREAMQNGRSIYLVNGNSRQEQIVDDLQSEIERALADQSQNLVS